MGCHNVYELLYMIRMKDAQAVSLLLQESRPHLKMTLNHLLSVFRSFYSSGDDLLQEAMILQLQTVDQYSEMRGSYAGYMHVVTRNSMLRYIRRQTAEVRSDWLNYSLDGGVNEGETYYDIVPQTDWLSDPKYRVRFDDALRNVMDEIDHMDRQEQGAFFCMQDNLTYAQGAKKLGMARKRYDYYVQKVRRRIRKAALRDLGYNPS